ncbi:Zinc finger PHD-finger [Penicillium citrinum]|uniref:Zinc finger PHD-finger n=2 Tax=Penicillium TaxID=5073 RepID=A0A9W9NY40_PENCI|nr:Zinc finger PHD-finger [Penicillium citrinum]KAJ5231899.1 Zinc finger PHD-finger [Penicillium citrinum]KAJ5579433.1 Zinc finger PHD-finger [Penicillium hetheringtonii]
MLISSIDAGKPHHFVCSKCYQPENLLGCGTCCRSYHVQCLPLGQGQEQPCSFHCPSCKSRAWDQAPPRLPASVVKSQDVTPVASTPASTDNSPLMARHNLPVGSSATLASPQEDDYERAHPSEDLPSISELYPYVQAYLAQADAPGHQSEFQHQIAGMLHEAESYRILLRKVAALREEFTRVQTENIQLKAYLNSRVPTREPVISSPSTLPSYIPRPSSDTDGKSWDSIVLDLI